MRALQQYEVDLVSGGDWNSFWNGVAKYFANLFGSGPGLSADVQLCTDNGGTATFTINGSSYNATANVGASAPIEGAVVPVGLNASGSSVVQTYNVTCTGASGNGNGGTIHNPQ